MSDFDTVAGALRADARDAATFLEVLAGKLEDALPGHVQVHRGGGLLARSRPVTELSVELGEERLDIRSPARGRLEPRRSRVVRGIVLKSEGVDLPEWIDALSHALVAEAERSEAARQALERMLT